MLVKTELFQLVNKLMIYIEILMNFDLNVIDFKLPALFF